MRRRLTSLHDRQFVQHGCYGNCSSSGFAAAAAAAIVVIGVLLRKQSERSARSVRDVKTQERSRRGSAGAACSLSKGKREISKTKEPLSDLPTERHHTVRAVELQACLVGCVVQQLL